MLLLGVLREGPARFLGSPTKVLPFRPGCCRSMARFLLLAGVLQGTPIELLFSLRFCSVGIQNSRFHDVFHSVSWLWEALQRYQILTFAAIL